MIDPKKCGVCGGSFSITFCKHVPDAIPLRCLHAADAEEHAKWKAPWYRDESGKQYFAVLKPVAIPDTINGKAVVRHGNELDLAETLKRPRVRPSARPHVHLTCQTCGYTTVEKVS